MQGNKLAQKQSRTIELGWIHQSTQVRKKTGGGTRKISIPKDVDSAVIREEAMKLYFPEGKSKKGLKIEDLDFTVCDFSNSAFPSKETVGQIYEREKPSDNLRFYLNSQFKPGVLPKENPSVASTATKADLQLRMPNVNTSVASTAKKPDLQLPNVNPSVASTATKNRSTAAQ